jgi:conjugal transfer ATP-binding protein TraC
MLSFFKSMAGRIRNEFVSDLDGVTAEEIEAMVKRDTFSGFLPYRAYDPEDHYYRNIDDSYGLLWEVSPLVYANGDTHEGIEQILKNVPFGTVVQVILYADPNIDSILDHHLSLHRDTGDDNAAAMATMTARMFGQAANSGFAQMGRIPCRNFRCFVAVKLFLKDGFDDEPRFLRDAIYQILKGAGLVPRPMVPQILCEFLQRIFNDQDNTPNPDVWRYNDQLPINRQIILGGTQTDIRFNHIRLGSEKLASIQTIKEYPKESLDDHTLNKIAGGLWGPKDDGNQCTFPFLVSVNIVVENLSYMFHGKANAMMVQDKRGSGAGHKMDRQEEFSWAARETDRGERFVRVIPSIVTFARTEKQVSENTALVKRLWEGQGFSINKDQVILGPLFLTSLPFGLIPTKNNIEFLQRDRIMLTTSAARMVPLQGDFAGYGQPVSLFVGRKGQIIPLEIFHKKAPNKNVIISATSGAGKTYLMNRILSDMLDTGVIVRAFDLGSGFEKLAKVKKGNFLQFGIDSKTSLNPYTTIRNIDEELELLHLIISQMVWSSGQHKPTETQRTIIMSAARHVWDQEGNEGDVDGVRRVLLNFDHCLKRHEIDLPVVNSKLKEMAAELAFNLGEFTGTGVYAHWFKGRSTLDIEKDRFVVLELQQLLDIKGLFNVVICQMINYVTRNLYLSDRENPRIIVFDEAWKWFEKGSFLGETVEHGYRLARKYNGGFITIFQNIAADIEKFGPSGEVINDNSAFKFFLHAKKGYDLAVERKVVDADPFMLDMLNSVETNKGYYSEIMIETPNNKGIARLPMDPFSHLLFTSDPDDNTAINLHARSKGISQIEAIIDLANKAA